MTKAPAIFFGHGSPMNALGGADAREWRALGQTLPKPKAVLMVSAHWYIPETAITAMAQPKTIHDFGGFPEELFALEYPAPGAPWLTERVAQALAPVPVRADQDWGLDHGTWSVLIHVWPDADVPIAQLSLDRTKPARFHYELGQKLQPLRDEGVMIAGSGDVVHNLGRMREGGAEPWAGDFHAHVKHAIAMSDDNALIEPSGEAALLSIPTPEHYLPLLSVLGARDADERPTFFTDHIELGAISMLGVRFG